jgi:hypothetical protein
MIPANTYDALKREDVGERLSMMSALEARGL